MAGETFKVEVLGESQEQKILQALAEHATRGLTESELEELLGVDSLGHDAIGITLELQKLQDKGKIVKRVDGKYILKVPYSGSTEELGSVADQE